MSDILGLDVRLVVAPSWRTLAVNIAPLRIRFIINVQ
jgi:hypothetical protein